MPPTYLDYNATTPIAPEVAQAMMPCITELFGNPSSSHWFGQQTRRAVETARAQVAQLLGCDAAEVIFTSGGSESNNLAIKGAAVARQERGRHVITSAVEHPAVTEVCRHLEGLGFAVTTLPVDTTGLVSVRELEQALSDETVLVTIMHANNEVGTIQPIAELAAAAHGRGALFHTDAAQSVGKIRTRVDRLGVDLLSIAGHKLYAPKGVGTLYIRDGVPLIKQTHGADHERNLRAGTENVLEIVGLGAAAASASQWLDKHAEHMRNMRDRLQQHLEEAALGARINGHPEQRLPNTLSVAFPGLQASALLDAVAAEVAASAGAACHTDAVKISAVLEAMQVPTEVAVGTLRLSTGRMTTAAEVDRAAEAIIAAAKQLRAQPQ